MVKLLWPSPLESATASSRNTACLMMFCIALPAVQNDLLLAYSGLAVTFATLVTLILF